MYSGALSGRRLGGGEGVCRRQKLLLKWINISTDKSLAKEYISKYRLAMPPSLLFLDKEGNPLWRADGELDLDLVK
jgi:hypothetical protein